MFVEFYFFSQFLKRRILKFSAKFPKIFFLDSAWQISVFNKVYILFDNFVEIFTFPLINSRFRRTPVGPTLPAARAQRAMKQVRLEDKLQKQRVPLRNCLKGNQSRLPDLSAPLHRTRSTIPQKLPPP